MLFVGYPLCTGMQRVRHNFKHACIHTHTNENWVLVTESFPTLCDTMDCTPPGSSIHGILQAWILEWVAIPFSRGSSWPRDQTWVSHISKQIHYCLNHQGSTYMYVYIYTYIYISITTALKERQGITARLRRITECLMNFWHHSHTLPSILYKSPFHCALGHIPT